MVRSRVKGNEPLPRPVAKAVALDFCARAANVDLWIHANLGDSREDVEPDCLAIYDTYMDVVHADRHLAVTLLRFAWARASWNEVKAAERSVSQRESERTRLADKILEFYDLHDGELQ